MKESDPRFSAQIRGQFFSPDGKNGVIGLI